MTLARFLAPKNLWADRFSTLCMVLGIALGTATVNVVLALDVNTREVEAGSWTTNPDLAPEVTGTVSLTPVREERSAPTRVVTQDVKEETHEDYQVMRSAIRLGSLSAYLVGALIVFFSLAVVVEHRYREVALLRSLGATTRQVAAVFVREAAWVGVAGALLGFLLSIPLTHLAARLGITTTGRARIEALWFPWTDMIWVSLLGAVTALLGVLPPLRKIVKMKAAEALRPRILETGRGIGRRTSGVTLLALPFALLVYGLLRPLLHEVLPSLLFFVLEAVLVMLALLALLLLVPDLTRALGALLARIFLHGPAAARLLLLKRVQRQGHELAWSVGGIMLVFALLLSLHISTHALKNEVSRFGEAALVNRAFVFTHGQKLPSDVSAAVPADVTVTRYSSRTPLPNPISAVSRAELIAFARSTGQAELVRIAENFHEDSVILSKFMARRLGAAVGALLELSSPAGKRTLRVVGITDGLGFVPIAGTYRDSKTYAIVEAASYPVLEPFSAPIGSALVLSPKFTDQRVSWANVVDGLPKHEGVFTYAGFGYMKHRWSETNRDFFIFDVILLLTTVLAAIGVTNQLVLAVHARRGEIALLRVLGMTADQIRKMLWLEGAFVGLLGGTLAVALGAPLGYGSLAALQAVSAFDVEFHLPLRYVLLTVSGAVGVALLAALYPAQRAARTQSAESVHYE